MKTGYYGHYHLSLPALSASSVSPFIVDFACAPAVGVWLVGLLVAWFQPVVFTLLRVCFELVTCSRQPTVLG